MGTTETYFFFIGDDDVHGQELWAIELDVFSNGFESGNTSAWSSVGGQQP